MNALRKILFFITMTLTATACTSTQPNADTPFVGRWALVEMSKFKDESDFYQSFYAEITVLSDEEKAQLKDTTNLYRFSGRGVNRFTTVAKIDHKNFDLESPMVNTKMAAFPKERAMLENHFFKALQAVTHYKVEGDALTLYYPEGELSFKFEPVTD